MDRLSADWRNVEDETLAGRNTLAMGMTSAFVGGMLELSVHPPRFVVSVSQHPQASALAREQAANSELVTNMRNGFIKLDAFARYVIGRLDGKHDRNEIAGAVREALDSGALPIKRADGGPTTINEETLSKLVDDTLTQLGKSALLIA